MNNFTQKVLFLIQKDHLPYVNESWEPYQIDINYPNNKHHNRYFEKFVNSKLKITEIEAYDKFINIKFSISKSTNLYNIYGSMKWISLDSYDESIFSPTLYKDRKNSIFSKHYHGIYNQNKNHLYIEPKFEETIHCLNRLQQNLCWQKLNLKPYFESYEFKIGTKFFNSTIIKGEVAKISNSELTYKLYFFDGISKKNHTIITQKIKIDSNLLEEKNKSNFYKQINSLYKEQKIISKIENNTVIIG